MKVATAPASSRLTSRTATSSESCSDESGTDPTSEAGRIDDQPVKVDGAFQQAIGDRAGNAALDNHTKECLARAPELVQTLSEGWNVARPDQHRLNLVGTALEREELGRDLGVREVEVDDLQ